jgi:hypothetical protein
LLTGGHHACEKFMSFGENFMIFGEIIDKIYHMYMY